MFVSVRRLRCSPLVVSGRHYGRLLGIETTCDDTAAAVVDTERRILGESITSQLKLHTLHGGILPPIAGDLHAKNISGVVERALRASGNDNGRGIDAVAVSTRPGLPTSLLVGLGHAKEICRKLSVPLIPIHHMEAHALTARLTTENLEFPFMVLLISGGHCLLGIAEGVDKFILLGKTLDDAPGEAFDKIARRLKLSNLAEFAGLSGGRAIESAAVGGDPTRYTVAEPLLHYRNCDFSFAGIKNSTRSIIVAEEEREDVMGDGLLSGVRDLCASVQVAVAKHLLRRVVRGILYCRLHHPQSHHFEDCHPIKLVVSGGVACNGYIRRALEMACTPLGVEVVAPPPRLCTDNGVMVAWNGVERWVTGEGVVSVKELHLVDIQPKYPFGEDVRDSVNTANVKIPPLPKIVNLPFKVESEFEENAAANF